MTPLQGTSTLAASTDVIFDHEVVNGGTAYEVRVGSLPEIPTHLSVLAGEVLHSLRSSLDLRISSVVQTVLDHDLAQESDGCAIGTKIPLVEVMGLEPLTT